MEHGHATDRRRRPPRRAHHLLWPLLALLLLIPPSVAQSTAPAESPDPFVTLDILWVFLGAVLVFVMQAGFALLGAGALRAKNTVNYLMKSVMDFAFGALVFFAVGFAFMFGASNGLIGRSGFFLGDPAPDGQTLVFFLFQVMFAATAATIVAGAVAERMRLKAYVAYTVIITALIYPVFGHWVWGGGFLATLPIGGGVVDFAGSGVVHAVGGLLAFVAAAVLGPRIGRYDETGRLREIQGHSATFVVLGTLLLFFGWFGFNAGSTLSASDPKVPLIAVNTFLAGCAGATVVFLIQFFRGPTRIPVVCNGALSGLVAVTASCAFVAPWAAVTIGASGGVVFLIGSAILERHIRIDDPVGAIPVHGFNGVVGLLAVGIFADGTNGVTGLFYGAPEQLVAQAVGVVVLLVWTLGTGFLLFKALDLTIGLRVTEAEELTGLDHSHHGEGVVPDVALAMSGVFRP